MLVDGSAPSISVVVPTCSRPGSIRRCVEHLARLDYPSQRFEVIVVDDGGGLPSQALDGSFRDGLALEVVRQARRGPAAARNTGAEHAEGAFVAFTDDDCLPDPGWLSALADRLAARPERPVGGRTVNALPENLCSSASQLLCDFLYERFNAHSDDARFLASNNFALSRELFRSVGGFDATFPLPAGEDRDICDRLVGAGATMTYAPDAVVRHAHPLDLAGYLAQHFRYGRGARCFRRFSRQRGGGARAESPGFYRDLVSFPLGRPASPLPRRLTLTTLVCVSQIATAGGFLWEAVPRSRQDAGS